MYVFWKYDNRFGCLGGRVIDDAHFGRVYVERYGTHTFSPFIRMEDDEQGERINRELDRLHSCMETEISNIRTKYAVAAIAVAPFLKGILPVGDIVTEVGTKGGPSPYKVMLKALKDIRTNAESQLVAMNALKYPETDPSYINAKWNYSVATSALLDKNVIALDQN